ncbi:MAG: carboxypeptidase regulatory-like domain-containing protein [candidate division KSB1 bacterium]|nr:carboxypeptidase regulatory-like domain-containing protein [candidate division KSB1 bacterium]
MRGFVCRWVLVSLVGAFCFSQVGEAGVTGKIRGVVRDQRTQEVLPGANVIIAARWIGNELAELPSPLGAATDENGEFVILNVPPGTYNVSARMMGYRPSTIEKVSVFVDRTTTLSFQLEPTVIEMKEVVVEARRDLIQVDVAGTESYITEEHYAKTPFANRIEDVLSLQSGISGNLIEGEIKIREGDTHEIGFLIDDVFMVDRKFNRPVISINPGIVQEIKIMRNGFMAEYGQARSGMINVVTKDPSEQFHFSLDYQLDPPHRPHYGRSIFDRANRWEYRLLDGPKAFEGDTLVLREGRQGIIKTWIGWNKFSQNLMRDADPSNDLTPQEAYELWKWTHRPRKYGHLAGHNVDFSLSGPVPVLPRTHFLLGGKYEFHPFFIPHARKGYDERVGSLKLVNRPREDIRIVLDGLYSEVRSVTQGTSTSKWSAEDLVSYDGGGYEIYYPYYKPVINRYTSLFGLKWVHTLTPRLFYQLNLGYFFVKWNLGRPDSARAEDGRYFHGRLYYDPQSGWIPKEKGFDDLASGYRMYGGALTWDRSYNRRYQVEGNLTYQISGSHEVKTGFQLYYDILHEDRVHWHNEDSTQKFIRYFHVKPITFAYFLQDKIEFRGMVAHVGLRLDYYSTNSDVWDVHAALSYPNNRAIFEAVRDGTYPKVRAKPLVYLSPRIGIAHPLTENSKIYFNYGHFVQECPTEAMYSSVLDYQIPRMQWLPNSQLSWQKTIAFELGYDHNIRDWLQLHVGAFYKDYHDQVSGMVYAHSDQSLIVEWASQRENREIRGIEVELRKALGRYVQGWINYNWIKKSVIDLSVPNLSQIPIITDDPSVGMHGELLGVPRPNIPYIAPNARGVVTFTLPSDWGPSVRGYRLFGGTYLSFLLYYEGGAQVRHPNSQFRDAHPNVIFRELDRYWANLRLGRYFRVLGLGGELYVDVSNILHSKYRYPPGGKAGEDYYDDLYFTGRLDKVGTDKVSDPAILRTESDNVYWARLKTVVFGLRLSR